MELLNKGPGGVDVYRPAGAAGSVYVPEGGVIEVEGELADEQPEDAVVIEHDGDARAWPLERWAPHAEMGERWQAIRARSAGEDEGQADGARLHEDARVRELDGDDEGK